jgi:hypothetical protein
VGSNPFGIKAASGPDPAPPASLVGEWSTDLRYHPGTIDAEDAEAFLESAEAILDWADGRM